MLSNYSKNWFKYFLVFSIKFINTILFKVVGKRFLISGVYNLTGSAFRINQILERIAGTSYLEIGTNYGFTIEGVNAENKNGVDPTKKFLASKGIKHHKKSSDDFFLINSQKFDLIFIDGLHEFKQVTRDIFNSLNALSNNGVILLDDVMPVNLELASKNFELLTLNEKKDIERGSFSWQGDVYKAMFLLLNEYKDLLHVKTIVDNDHIQSVIYKKNSKLLFKYPSPNLIDKYDQIDFLSKIKLGVPKQWNPCTLETLLSSLNSR